MAMFITQDTFDEVVKENMEDFGMDRKSAAEDAMGQFKAQGADLSRVDTSADGIRTDARATINAHLEKLRAVDLNVVSEGEGGLRSECLGALSTVAELCREDGDDGEANRMAAGEAGGVGVIARYLDADEERASSSPSPSPSPVASLVLAALSALQDVCRNTERNRDAFIYANMDQLTSLLLRWTNADALGDAAGGEQSVMTEGANTTANSDTAAKKKAALVAAGLKTVRLVCTKADNNKASFMRRKGAQLLLASLRLYGTGDAKDGTVTKEACYALRSLTMGDDRRKEFSCAYDNVKTLVSAGAIPLLLDTARAFEGDSTTLSSVYLALKQLAANDESVKLIVDKGGLDLVSGAVVNFPLEALVCRTALALFRNISANDVLKTRLLQEGGLRLVLGCMSQHTNDKTLQEHGCATMAAMALRSPSNGAQIVQEGGITAVLAAMRTHPTVQPLQRQACLCIRNIAARAPGLRSDLLDDGCETAVRNAGKLRGCIDEAYAALRDLHCEVGLVTMGEDGKVQVGVKAFGEEKPNFNPTPQETKDLAQRIEGNAQAPAHVGYGL
eukprot:g5863.t1